MPRTAVLVRVYSWDEFDFRSTVRLWDRCDGLDLYVLADETQSGPLDVRPFHKLAHSVAYFEKLGLPCVAPTNVSPLWWSCDYGLYDAALRLPDYDYYFVIENDVAVNLNIRLLAERLADAGLDCVTGFSHHRMTADWAYADSCAHLPYARRSWTQLCVMFVSRRAALHLLAERRELALRRAEGNLVEWPFCEGFFSSAILAAGLTTARLHEFADLTHFAAETSYLETDARARQPGSMVHSVLDIDRYWRKFVARSFNRLLAQGRYDEFREVRETLARTGRRCHQQWVITANPDNLALDRPAYQSSRSKWSRRALRDDVDPRTLDARGANCGVLTGSYGFHSELQDDPWWSVDLGERRTIAVVRIFNGTKSPERSRHLCVKVSGDGMQWNVVYRKIDEAVFAGNDSPLECRFDPPVVARHVRVQIEGRGVLHLAEVEVYGCADPDCSTRHDPAESIGRNPFGPV